MKTIRTAKLGDLELRLVEKDKQYIGLIFSSRRPKIQIQGSSADDVWRRLHDAEVLGVISRSPGFF